MTLSLGSHCTACKGKSCVVRWSRYVQALLVFLFCLLYHIHGSLSIQRPKSRQLETRSWHGVTLHLELLRHMQALTYTVVIVRNWDIFGRAFGRYVRGG